MTDISRELIEFTNTRPGYKNRDGSFLTTPKKMIRDPNLSDAEFRVLSYLHERAGNPKLELYSAENRQWCRIAFPAMETIAQDTNRSKRQAQEAVTSLELKGYVKIIKRKTARGINNQYLILFPASYEALDNVDHFIQEVVTGKKLAKRESAESRIEEGSAEFLSTPSAEFLLTPNAENRTVNSSLEDSSIETGTSTYQPPTAAGTEETYQEISLSSGDPSSAYGAISPNSVSSGDAIGAPAPLEEDSSISAGYAESPAPIGAPDENSAVMNVSTGVGGPEDMQELIDITRSYEAVRAEMARRQREKTEARESKIAAARAAFVPDMEEQQ